MIPDKDGLALGGVARMNLVLPKKEAHKAVIKGLDHLRWHNHGDHFVVTGERHNAFLNQGLQRALDLLFEDTQGSLTGISHIALSGDSTAVTASTTTIGTPNNIKAVTNVSRTNQTTHGEATWTQADVAFAIRKIGFLWSAAATSVLNIIGGAGGASPYNEDFTVDLTNVTSWNLTFGIDLTATAS